VGLPRIAMAAAIDGLKPKVYWQFQLDSDWQPFTLGASAAVEARHAMWVAGLGPPLVREKSGCGQLEYVVDFSTMTQQSASLGVARPVRRDELYDRETVEALVLDLRRERRAREAAEAAAAEAASERVSGTSPFASRCPSTAVGLQDGGATSVVTVSALTQAPGAERRAVGEDVESKVHVGDVWAGDASAGDAPATDSQMGDTQASDALALRSGAWRSLDELSDRLFALPSHMLADKPFEVTPLALVDPRRQWLENYFVSNFEQHRRSMGDDVLCPRAEIEVRHVMEVYNPLAVQAYRNELALMRQKRPDGCAPVEGLDQALHVRTDLGGPRLNEVLLFHGTSWAASTRILHEGFDPRLHGNHAGTAFGAGSYFTPVASKADFYTQQTGDSAAPPDGDPRQRVVLVGRVALGEVHRAPHYTQSLRRPPSNTEGVPFDSVLGLPSSSGGVLDFPELVVYKANQVIPQFVICYRHKIGCRCRTCTV